MDTYYIEGLQKKGWKQIGQCCGSRRIFETPEGTLFIVTMENGIHRRTIRSISSPFSSKEEIQKSVHPAIVEWHKN